MKQKKSFLIKLLFLSIIFLFSLDCNCQIIKMRAKQFAFIQNLADSSEAPIFIPTDRLVFLDYNSLKITFFGEVEEIFYISDQQKRQVEKSSENYLFDCIRDDGKKCSLKVYVWTDKTHTYQIYMRIKTSNSLFIYNLDFVE